MGESLSRTKEYLHTQVDLSERTRRKYLTVADRFFKEYEDLTVENVNKFIVTALKKRRSYYIKYAFKYIFAAAGDDKSYQQLTKVRIKEASPKAVYIDKDDLLRIISSMPTLRHRMIATIQYCTGIRASEVLGIRKTNAIYERDMIRLKLKQKGGDERVAFIPKRYASKVYAFIEDSKSPFPFMREFTITSDQSIENSVDANYHAYWRELKDVADKLGYEGFSTHDFRRNFIDDVYGRTKDIVITKTAAGHKKVETTLRYINKHTDPEKVRKITEEVRGDD